MPRIAYFDCPAGASGDMILAAFLDAGLPLDFLERQLAGLGLTGYRLFRESIRKKGLTATRFRVEIQADQHYRNWRDIRSMIRGSGLDSPIKDTALGIFSRLARVEAQIHGFPEDEVHFHEVGAVDSIVDIVGAAIAWHYFQFDRAHASPLPLGHGWIETDHGRMPLPAPATLALLEKVPCYGSGLAVEMVTPTGAAVLTALVHEFGPRPAMIPTGLGYGAGARDLPDRPNVLRLTVGETSEESLHETLVVGETNIDDGNPEFLPYVMERLMDAGALDAWVESILMKKGRPGIKLSFLARPEQAAGLEDLVLKETTTIGLRKYSVHRKALPRQILDLDTPWGPARVKRIDRLGRIDLVPEFEACRDLAQISGLPLQDVYATVRSIAQERFAREQDGRRDG